MTGDGAKCTPHALFNHACSTCRAPDCIILSVSLAWPVWPFPAHYFVTLHPTFSLLSGPLLLRPDGDIGACVGDKCATRYGQWCVLLSFHPNHANHRLVVECVAFAPSVTVADECFELRFERHRWSPGHLGETF